MVTEFQTELQQKLNSEFHSEKHLASPINTIYLRYVLNLCFYLIQRSFRILCQLAIWCLLQLDSSKRGHNWTFSTTFLGEFLQLCAFFYQGVSIRAFTKSTPFCKFYVPTVRNRYLVTWASGYTFLLLTYLSISMFDKFSRPLKKTLIDTQST